MKLLESEKAFLAWLVFVAALVILDLMLPPDRPPLP